MAALLQIDDLEVTLPTRRGPLALLNGVSLEIAEGEVLGVVGESGAGKSITGLSIVGLLEPPAAINGGVIAYRGQDITHLAGEQRRRLRGAEIGVIFQDPLTSLNPLYTIGRQLTETIRTHLDMSAAEAADRAVDLLEEVGIPLPGDRLGAYPHEFSGGMRQRVVIALALCAEPSLIIADEPTTALDVSIQAQIISLLKRLSADHGTAVMLITHDMGVIAETADRVAVMYAGRIVEEGPVAEIVRAPRHPYTAGLMASIPVIGAHQKRLSQIEGAMPRPGELPPGCPFAPRCPEARPACTGERPDVRQAGATRAACWMYHPRWQEMAHA